MLKSLTRVVVLALAWRAAPALAQTDCSKTPFQMSNQVDVQVGPGGRSHGTVAVRLTGLTEIEQISVRFNNPNVNLVGITSSQVTTQLNGVSVKHGIDVRSNL